MFKLDQTCSNWIKLVQIGSNLSKLDQTCSKWIKHVQIGSKLSKMDQICPNWIKHVQIGSNLFKMDQTCLKWIILFILNQTSSNWISQNLSESLGIAQRILKRTCRISHNPVESQKIMQNPTKFLTIHHFSQLSSLYPILHKVTDQLISVFSM